MEFEYLNFLTKLIKNKGMCIWIENVIMCEKTELNLARRFLILYYGTM